MDGVKGARQKPLEGRLRDLKPALHVAAHTCAACQPGKLQRIVMSQMCSVMGLAGGCSPLQLFVMLRQLRLIGEHANRIIVQDMAGVCRQGHKDDHIASIQIGQGRGLSLAESLQMLWCRCAILAAGALAYL